MGGEVEIFSGCEWAQSPSQLATFVKAIRSDQDDKGEVSTAGLVVCDLYGMAVPQEQVLQRV